MLSTQERVTSLLSAAVTPEKMSPRVQHWLADMKDFSLADFGISSVEAQALLTQIETEFGVEIPPEEAEKFRSVEELSSYIESRS